MGYKLTGIYIGQDKVRPIGWQPGADTIAYYPLVEDVLDYSGNGNNGTGSPTSFTGGVANYNGNYTILPYSIINRNNYTVSLWANSNSPRLFLAQHTEYTWGFCLQLNPTQQVWWRTGDAYSNYQIDYQNSSLSGWHHIVCIADSGTAKLYVDGVLRNSGTFGGNNGEALYLGRDNGNAGGDWDGKLSKIIVEDVVRDATQVADYYNLTKGDYGIS